MAMNRLFGAIARKSSIVAVSLSIAAVAQAQQPGTNLTTPPPSNPGPDASPAMPQPVEAGFAAEPVIPAVSTKRKVPNVPLLVTGAVLLGGSYGASAIVAATSSRKADNNLYAPVAGPWVDLDRRNCDLHPCSHKTLDQALLIGDGVVQGIGALGVLLSFVIPEKVTRHWYLIGETPVTVMPYLGSAMTGIGAVGHF